MNQIGLYLGPRMNLFWVNKLSDPSFQHQTAHLEAMQANEEDLIGRNTDLVNRASSKLDTLCSIKFIFLNLSASGYQLWGPFLEFHQILSLYKQVIWLFRNSEINQSIEQVFVSQIIISF